MNFKLTPFSKKNYKSLLIYKNTLIENHAIHVQIKMGVRKFLSAYMSSETDEVFHININNYFSF